MANNEPVIGPDQPASKREPDIPARADTRDRVTGEPTPEADFGVDDLLRIQTQAGRSEGDAMRLAVDEVHRVRSL